VGMDCVVGRAGIALDSNGGNRNSIRRLLNEVRGNDD